MKRQNVETPKRQKQTALLFAILALAGHAGARILSRTLLRSCVNPFSHAGLSTLCTLAFLALAGCRADLPKGYVRVEESGDARMRAVSADECVLTLRSEKNPDGGDLVFWEKTIVSRLTDIRGYKLANRMEVHNGATSGAELIFDYARDGLDYTYVLGLFVKNGQVHVFEAAGEKEKIAKDLAGLTKTMQDWPL